MRYAELITERSATDDVQQLAAASVLEVMRSLGREDVVFHYSENVAAPVLAALRSVARGCESASHPLQVHLDFHKRGTAFGSFNETQADGFIVIELWAILNSLFDLESPKWDAYGSVMDLEPAALKVADVFSHEFLHYRQHLSAWGRTRRTISPRIKRSKPASDYLSSGAEIQAFAADAARELHRAFGPEVVAAMRDGRAEQASPIYSRYARLDEPQTMKVFLRHLVASLPEARGEVREAMSVMRSLIDIVGERLNEEATQHLKTSHDILALRPAMAKAAQDEYDAWAPVDGDLEGFEAEFAGGGICHLIAEKLAGIMDAAGVNCATVSSSHEQHVYCVAQCQDGIFLVDVPHGIYETGGGYNWTRVEGVVFESEDIVVRRIDRDPANMAMYTDD